MARAYFRMIESRFTIPNLSLVLVHDPGKDAMSRLASISRGEIGSITFISRRQIDHTSSSTKGTTGWNGTYGHIAIDHKER